MSIKPLTIIAIITSLLAMALLLNTCRLNRKITSQNTTITQQQLENQSLDSISNKQKQIIFTQTTINTQSQKVIKQLTDSVFNLKNKDSRNQEVIAYYKGKTNTVIKDKLVPYLDSTTLHRFGDSISQSVAQYIQDSTVRVGTPALLSTPNVYLAQTIQQRGVQIDSLSIPNTLQLRFVEKKGGLFKQARVEVQYFNSNPLVRTTSSNSVYYTPKKKSFFTRVLLPVGIGVGAGLLIGR